jgi:lipopolysaccharide export system permease protein
MSFPSPGEVSLTIIDRHVLRQTLVVALVTTLIGLLVLSAARFLIIFDMVLGNDQGLLIVARMLGAFVPHYLAYMLPLALYWASYSTVRRMTVGSEVSILQATGSSIARSFRALVVLGVVVAALNVAVVGWLQPLGRYTYRALMYKLETADFYLRLRESTFTKVGPRTILVDKINPDRRSFEKIFIYEPLDKGGSLTIVAERGEITKVAEQLSLRLRDGRRTLLAAGPEDGNRQVMRFAELDVPVGNAAAAFRPRGDDEQELLLPELLRQNAPLADASVADIAANTHKRLVIALSCLFLPLLAVALGVQSARKRNVYQSIIAVLVIIIYHQLVEFAGDVGRSLAIGPAALLWLTYGVFFTASAVLFYKTSTGIGTLRDRLASTRARWARDSRAAPWRRSAQTP